MKMRVCVVKLDKIGSEISEKLMKLKLRLCFELKNSCPTLKHLRFVWSPGASVDRRSWHFFPATHEQLCASQAL